MELYLANRKVANSMIAKVMVVTFYIFSVICGLNEMGFFVFNVHSMRIGYMIGSVFLLLPTFLNKSFGEDNKWLPYIYVVDSGLFVMMLAITVSYHAIIMYIFPIALTSFYFSKRLNRLAYFVTAIAIAVGQSGAHFLNPLPDLNFVSLNSLIWYDILPKEMCLVAIAVLYYLMTERTSVILHALKEDSRLFAAQHEEMIMGFATLVENRDESTGGHIKRTRAYTDLIVRGLRERGIYSEQISDEFAENIVKAAALHDIGKIKTPDAILQKPGKLTDEEFETMKLHAPEGRRIIKETFHESSDEKYMRMASDVAGYHHEKWNGRGYPTGKSGEDIPLSARIMAVADVFDAISEHRCYRAAMPMDKCFAIIEEGRGEHFDPQIVDVFMELREEVERIHGQLNS